MALLKCNACGGEYRDVQKDGTSYQHVCPPEIVLRLRDPFGNEEELAIAQCAGLELLDAEAVKAITDKGETLKADQREILARRDRRRADRRDENPDLGIVRKDGTHPPRLEGAGATLLKTDAELALEDADAL
jgi:hypothetical protein